MSCASNCGEGVWGCDCGCQAWKPGAVNISLEPGEGTGDLQGTALYEAAAEGHSEIVGILLEKYGDPDLRDTKAQSLADVAGVKGHGNSAQKVKRPIVEMAKKGCKT